MTLSINRKTRVLIQGITGREARMFTAESMEYGTNVVSGVTPGRGDTNVFGVPVFDTVAEAVLLTRAEASLVSVPAPFVLDAALEAIDSGLKLLVIPTERVPHSDIVHVLEAASDSRCRVIGPNSLGVIVPGETRIGIAGGSASLAKRWYSRGAVAVASRSGGMMTEIASMLTRQGIGQRICISVGGDSIVGTTFAEVYDWAAEDTETHVMVVFGEPGGVMEECLAQRLLERPGLRVVAYIAGRFADEHQGVRFGHAGTIVMGDSGSVRTKVRALSQAGAVVADAIDDIPRIVRAVMSHDSSR